MKKNAGLSLRSVVAGSAALDVSSSVVIRQKTVLKSSCAALALLGLPAAALSVGIVLARPAQAQTTLGPSSSTPSLSNYGSGNPFTVNSGTAIVTGSGDGIFGDGSQNWTLNNYGTVSGGTANGIGFGNGGTITNESTYVYPNTVTGTIIGATDGVYIAGAAGSVSNGGTIIGTGNNGIELTVGGSVGNAGTGTIAGGINGVVMASGYGLVSNQGSIGGTTGTGVSLDTAYLGNATVNNSGHITGGDYGVKLSGDASFGGVETVNAVLNAGTIMQSSTGVSDAGVAVQGYAEIYNGFSTVGPSTTVVNTGALISGQTTGIFGTLGAQSVENVGTISGSGTAIALAAGEVNNSGSILGGSMGISIGGTQALVFNSTYGTLAPGLISGSSVGVLISGADGFVQNSAIIDGYLNVDGALSGTGVSMAGGGTLTNLSGGTISGGALGVGIAGNPAGIYNAGLINGHAGTGVALAAGGSVVNHGTIYGGTGISIAGSGYVGNLAGSGTGYISASSAGIVLSGPDGNVVNAGTIIVNNLGSIPGEGVYLQQGGSVSNATGGSVTAYGDGVDIAGGSGTVTNGGVITGMGQYGTSGIGVHLAGGGYVGNNGGTIFGSLIGAAFDGMGTLVNSGSIYAGKYGVLLNGGGFVTNASGGYIKGAAAGVYVAGPAAGQLYNDGSILGNQGVKFGNGGTVYNSGTILGQSKAVAIYGGPGYVLNTNIISIGSSITPMVVGPELMSSVTGVYMQSGGTVANNGGYIYGTGYGVRLLGTNASSVNNAGGLIRGGYVGVRLDGVQNSLDNSGLIYGGNTGVWLSNGGSVNNAVGGLINGGLYGVDLTNVAGTVTNAGSIGGYRDGVSLYGGELNNASTGTIHSAYVGVYAYNAATIVNSGTILSDDLNDSGTIIGHRAGVYLYNGGSVTNNAGGTIAGGDGVFSRYGAATVSNSGTIQGVFGGVAVTHGGTLTNQSGGTISGGFVGAYVTGSYSGGIDNLAGGTITGGIYGVALFGPQNTLYNGGLVQSSSHSGVLAIGGGGIVNTATGTIAGGDYGMLVAGGAPSISNAGLITGGTDAGILLTAGGTINNAAGGTISGGAAGISTGTVAGNYPVDVINSGIITGSADAGIMVSTGGSITNNAGGTISGDLFGIQAAQMASVTNSGLITSFNPDTGTGVDLAAGGGVTNEAGGTIAGSEYAVYVSGAAGTVSNAGSIGAGSYGVDLRVGGGLANFAGGTINGSVYGAVIAGAAGTVVNGGSIAGGDTGVVLDAGGSVVNAGVISGAGHGVLVYAQPGYVTNSGTIMSNVADNFSVMLRGGGTVTNTGLIEGGDGVLIDGGNPTVSNAAGATISGNYDGVYVSGANASVGNAGSINATYGYGVVINGTSAASMTNSLGGTITAYESGVFAYDGVSLQNDGQIASRNYDGVYLYNGGTVTNTGSISGAHDGIMLGTSYNSATNTGTVFNSGVVSGGLVGIAGYGSAFAVQNSGLISGGAGIQLAGGPAVVGNSGTIVGTYGNAIDLAAGGSVANQGSIIGFTNGIVVGAPASVTNSGVIQGNGASGDGVLLAAGGTVTNQAGGTITGNAGGVVGYQYVAFVGNAGSIGAAGGDAVDLLAGGTVSNSAGGTITSNDTAINLAMAGAVANDGVIAGGVYGANLGGGGTLTNSATGRISGGTDGVYAPVGAVVDNAGSIVGTTGDGVLVVGGALNNAAGGFIKGGTDGIYAGAGANVSNAGTIMDNTTAGAMLGDNVLLYNNGGGLISGATGIAFIGTGASVYDNGMIASTNGGDAVSFDAAGTNTLTLATGAAIVGAIDGGGSNSTIDLVGTGALNNTIANFGAGSAVNIEPGAYWTATGHWTVATVTNSGLFQAGTLNPDPPLYLNGNFVQTTTGTLQVVVTPTLSTQFIVSGTARLAGGLKYIFTPGLYAPHTYNFLTAADGVTGNFATINYSGDVPPTVAIAHTTTGNALADTLVLSLGTGVPGNHDAFIVTPADDSLYSAQAEEMATAAQQANDSLLGHATDALSGDDEARRASCAAAERVPTGGTSTASRMASAMASAFCGAGGWVEATGTAMNVNGSADATAFHATTGGFLAGIDKAVGPSGGRLGLAVGYDETWLHDDAGGKGTIGTTRVGLYGAQPVGRFSLAGDFMYGHADNTIQRATGVGEAHGQHGSDIVSGAVQLSTGLGFFGGFALTPAAGLRVAHVSGGGFSETGAGYVPYFAVSGTSPEFTSVQPFVKLGISRDFVTQSNIVITPAASIGYDYEASDRGQRASVTSRDGTSFATGTNRLDASAANVSAGLSVGKGAWSLYARYSAYLSGNWTAQSGEAGLQVKF